MAHEGNGCSRNMLMHFSCDPTHKAGLPDNTLAKAQMPIYHEGVISQIKML